MQATSIVTECCLLSETFGGFRLPSLAELCQYRILVCTCAAAAFLLRYRGHPLRCPVHVSRCFVDEAGQAPLLEALLPMQLTAPETGGICLVGDPRQLGPVVRSPIAATGGLGESMLERLIDYYQGLPEAAPGRALCTVLVQNYRSHERLLRLPSDLFYGSALVAAAAKELTRAPPWTVLGTARALPCPAARDTHPCC